MNDKIKAAYRIAMSGYFGLFMLMMLWTIWLAPPEKLPISLALIVAVGPLMFPLRGLLHARPYTFAWTGFLALLYLLHGTVEAWSSPAVRYLALLETLFSLLLFFGAAYFARWGGKAQKELNQATDEQKE